MIPPINHRTNATMKIAPKMVTREMVFALRWKICAIEGDSAPGNRDAANEERGRRGERDHIQFQITCKSERSYGGARHASADDQSHDAGAVRGEGRDARRLHDHHASGHAV